MTLNEDPLGPLSPDFATQFVRDVRRPPCQLYLISPLDVTGIERAGETVGEGAGHVERRDQVKLARRAAHVADESRREIGRQGAERVFVQGHGAFPAPVWQPVEGFWGPKFTKFTLARVLRVALQVTINSK